MQRPPTPTPTSDDPPGMPARPRHWPLLLAILLGATVLALGAANAQPPDNQGTVKVHDPGAEPDESNDPHVGCTFYVEGFNMQASSGTLVIKDWEPTGNGTVVIDDTWVKDDDEEEGHHFENGPYTLEDGHYKLFVSDEQHDKQKVFWVDCEPGGSGSESPSSSDTSTTASTSDSASTTDPDTPGESDTPTATTTPTTQIPVFPSWASVVLGSAGALGGALVILRRRL